MEQTCRGELLVSGPAANLRCLSNQIEQIRRVTAAPDFTGISAADRQAMEQTCRGELLVSGPAANLRCLSNQIEQIRRVTAAPDFTGISAADRQAMEQTCRGELLVSGPAANLRCLSNQIEQIRRVTAAPDFTGISAADRQAMEQTCRGELLVSGPAANLRCLSNQIEQIRQLAGAITPPKEGVDLSLTTRTEVVPEETTGARQPTALVHEENALTQPAQGYSSRFRQASGLPPIEDNEDSTALSSSTPVPFGLPTGSAVPQAAEPLPAAQGYSSRFRQASGLPPIEDNEDSTALSSSTPVPFGLPTGSAVPQAAEPLPAATRRPAASDDSSEVLLVLTVLAFVLFLWVGFLVASKAKPCSNCSASTGDPSGVCDSCRAERDRQQRAEADGEKRRKEETSRKQQEEKRRRHEEEARRTFDPYVVLGVPRLAGQDEIKRAYREMMTKYHPDKVSHLGSEFREMARVRAEAINRAYEMLRI